MSDLKASAISLQFHEKPLKKKKKKPNMIIQATKTKAYTKALKIILEGRMQENSKQLYLLLNNLPFQTSKTSLFTTGDTTLNLCYPISYSTALLWLWHPTLLLPCKQNTVIYFNTCKFYFTNQHSIAWNAQQPPKSGKHTVNKHKNSYSVSYLEFFFCVWNLCKLFSKLIFKSSYFVIFDVNAETRKNS